VLSSRGTALADVRPNWCELPELVDGIADAGLHPHHRFRRRQHAALFDWVGADKYGVGPPVPNIVGVPFLYAQYGFLVGIELGG
jgi:hypothetical protein